MTSLSKSGKVTGPSVGRLECQEGVGGGVKWKLVSCSASSPPLVSKQQATVSPPAPSAMECPSAISILLIPRTNLVFRTDLGGGERREKRRGSPVCRPKPARSSPPTKPHRRRNEAVYKICHYRLPSHNKRAENTHLAGKGLGERENPERGSSDGADGKGKCSFCSDEGFRLCHAWVCSWDSLAEYHPPTPGIKSLVAQVRFLSFFLV